MTFLKDVIFVGEFNFKYKEKQKEQNIFVVNKLLHFAVSLVLFYLFWLLFRFQTIMVPSYRGFRYNYYALFVYGFLLLYFNRIYNAYLLGYSRIRSLALGQFISQVFSFIIIYFIASLSWNQFKNPSIFLALLVTQLAFDFAWSYQANGLYFKHNPTKKTILIYRNEEDLSHFGSIKGKPSERLYEVTERYQYEGYRFKEIEPHLEGYEAVFVAGVNSRCRNGITKYCIEHDIPGFFLPHVGDVLMQGAVHIQSFTSPVMNITRKTLPTDYVLIKRAFDIFASLCGIIVLSPVMLITALAIRLYDGGPAIYKQTRLTQYGREFEIYKFRSMRVDAEKDGVARLSSGEKDDRITPIGHFVRKCRLDELPQLFNILKGDMSIVGPRPERPEIAAQYYESLPDFKLRLQVKAGLTGYAQVYGKYNSSPYEKLEFDLLYINNMNVFTDLQLMFATFSVLFSKESTEGIASGQTTAVGQNYHIEDM